MKAELLEKQITARPLVLRIQRIGPILRLQCFQVAPVRLGSFQVGVGSFVLHLGGHNGAGCGRLA